MEISKHFRLSALDLPVEIWVEIISKLHHDRHCDFNLQSLSLVCKFFLSITNSLKQTLIISNPTSHFLPSLFHRFPNLKHLSLSDFSGDPNPILLQIADFDFRLESLDLSNHKCPPIEALQRLPVSLRGLKSFKIGTFYHVLGDDDLQTFANSFRNLEELDLSCSALYFYVNETDYFNQVRVTDDGISVLASKLKGLRRINLNGHHRLSDNCLISLAKNCPDLEEIEVEDCHYVTKSGIGFALQACKNLKMVRYGADKCTEIFESGENVILDDIIKPLSCALSLSAIHIYNCIVTDSSLFGLANASIPLKSLTLIYCKSFTYAGISSLLTRYDSLDHLALESVSSLSDNHMITLAKSLTKARTVKLDDCTNLSESTLLTLIKQCPLLETVHMRYTNIGNQGFVAGNALNTRMKTLDLSLNRRLSDETLEKIALACPNLEALQLVSCSRISTKGVVETFRNCRRLKRLEIAGCYCVKSLGLDINNQELQFLDASRTGLEDDALIDIAEKCPNLVFLNVKGCCGLTSKGVIQVVDKCTKLKEINLPDSYTTEKCSAFEFLHWMVFNRPSLRKIVLPKGDSRCKDYDENMEALFMRHGCYVIEAFSQW